MSEEKKHSRRKAFLNTLKTKFRFVVMNDETFEEKFSVVLKPLSIFITAGTFSLFMLVLIIYIIAFTPLREYIPGYADTGMRRRVIALNVKTDSMQLELRQKDLYINNIKDIISGQPRTKRPEKNKQDSTTKYTNLYVKPSREDSLLRAEIEAQDQYSLSIGRTGKSRGGISNFFFFAPVRGIVTSSFKSSPDHYGVDIVAKQNEAIKATLDGTVLFASWTPETGYVIQIQHDNDLVSLYKHNSVLLKKAGNRVQAGEAIAIIGDSGEQSTGPHLHFELWYKGTPINPQEYISF
jgi:murein DD-endopeptidase MepM/ murein hydrolase activator NlpD